LQIFNAHLRFIVVKPLISTNRSPGLRRT
jgi:hypothetical protein